MQSDPIGLGGGINTFGYVNGRPLLARDRFGLAAGLIEGYPISGSGIGNAPYGNGTSGGALEFEKMWRKYAENQIHYPSWLTQSSGAVRDFYENYNNMRDANTIGADKYFHCMANCKSARRGEIGEAISCLISDTREWTDQKIKGDSRAASNNDHFANVSGRSGGAITNAQCKKICEPFRPKGLPSLY